MNRGREGGIETPLEVKPLPGPKLETGLRKNTESTQWGITFRANLRRSAG